MTIKRKYSGGMDLGMWFREQPEIDSKKGYLISDVDFMYYHRYSGLWMLLEVKCKISEPKSWHRNMLLILDKCAKNDPNYRGFHLISFENSTPDNGRIFINTRHVTKEQFMLFLQYKKYETSATSKLYKQLQNDRKIYK